MTGLTPRITCANDNEFGLSAAVFGRDIARAWSVAQRIQSGICHVNGPTVHDEAQMPFGGTEGSSGYGRFGGKAGIDAFTELRWMTHPNRAAPLPILIFCRRHYELMKPPNTPQHSRKPPLRD